MEKDSIYTIVGFLVGLLLLSIVLGMYYDNRRKEYKPVSTSKF